MDSVTFQSFVGVPFIMLVTFAAQPFLLRSLHEDEGARTEWGYDVFTRFSLKIFFATAFILLVISAVSIEVDEIKAMVFWFFAFFFLVTLCVQTVVFYLRKLWVPFSIFNLILIIFCWLFMALLILRWTGSLEWALGL